MHIAVLSWMQYKIISSRVGNTAVPLGVYLTQPITAIILSYPGVLSPAKTGVGDGVSDGK